MRALANPVQIMPFKAIYNGTQFVCSTQWLTQFSLDWVASAVGFRSYFAMFIRCLVLGSNCVRVCAIRNMIRVKQRQSHCSKTIVCQRLEQQSISCCMTLSFWVLPCYNCMTSVFYFKKTEYLIVVSHIRLYSQFVRTNL